MSNQTLVRYCDVCGEWSSTREEIEIEGKRIMVCEYCKRVCERIKALIE